MCFDCPVLAQKHFVFDIQAVRKSRWMNQNRSPQLSNTNSFHVNVQNVISDIYFDKHSKKDLRSATVKLCKNSVDSAVAESKVLLVLQANENWWAFYSVLPAPVHKYNL